MAPARIIVTDSFSDVRRGLALMILGAFFIPGLDAAAKLLTERHGLSAGQIGLLRFGLQTTMVFPLLVAAEGLAGLRIDRPALHLLRGVLLGLATVFFFIALKFMALADATAIFFLEPLVVTILSVIFLKERVGWRRVVAILVGFCGVMIVIRPNFLTLGPVAILPALTAVLVAVYAVLSRSLSQTSSPLAMHFYAGVGGCAVLSVGCLVGVLAGIPDLSLTLPSGVEAYALILTLGLFATVCHLMFIHAYKLAPASVLAPFGYIEILSAVLLGLVLFGEFPDPVIWIGIAVIVASGVYIAWRENLVVRKAPPVPHP